MTTLRISHDSQQWKSPLEKQYCEFHPETWLSNETQASFETAGEADR